MDDSDYDRPPDCEQKKEKSSKEDNGFFKCVFVGLLMVVVVLIADRNREWWCKLTPGTIRYNVEQSNPFADAYTNSVYIIDSKEGWVKTKTYHHGCYIGEQVLRTRIVQGLYPYVKFGTGEPAWWERLLFYGDVRYERKVEN